MKPTKITFGSRGSKLALAQTRSMIAALQRLHPGLECDIRIISTSGDRDQHTPLTTMSQQGVFVREIESALLQGSIDAAVHSLKDLPTQQPEGLLIAAIPEREDARDVLLSRAGSVQDLPAGARVGTSSTRRRCQLLFLNPQVSAEHIRGNVDTRIRKLHEGEYEAIILAAAGLHRLGLAHEIDDYLDLEEFLPAPAQGALALEIAANRHDVRELLEPLNDFNTRAAVLAEREVLKTLGSGCSLPMAAHARIVEGRLILQAAYFREQGEEKLTITRSGHPEDAVAIGKEAGTSLIEHGALQHFEKQTSKIRSGRA